MPITRPHRRDRRRPAPNTPGGQIRRIATAAFSSLDSATEFIAQFVSVGLMAGVPTETDELFPATTTLDPSTIRVTAAGSPVGVDSITILANGVFIIVTLAPLAGQVEVLMPAFLPGLTFQSGATFGGAKLSFDAP